MDWLMKMCMSGQAIYDNFHQGRGPDGLATAATEVKALIENYETRKGSITKLTERMESAWQGDAGGAARRGAGPLAVEHGLAAPEMNTAQSHVDSQVQAFGSAKGSVMPIPPEPKEPGFWDNVFSFGGASDTYEKQKTAYNAANDHNVTVMSNYEGVTDTNTSGMPKSYGSIAADQSGIGVVEQKTPPPPPRRRPPEVSNTGDPGDRSSTNPTGTPPRTGDPGTQLGPNGPIGPNTPGPQQPGPTDPSRHTPVPTLPRGQGGGPGTGPGGPGTDVPGIGPGFLPAATGFGPVGGGGGSGGGTGAGGGRGPGSGSGAGTRGGFGPGGGPGAGSEEGARPGARGAAAALGAGAGPEGAGGRGAAGGAGGRGGAMGGMPMGAGGRGQGGEDSEHQRPSFLVEADPDETFGTDEVTAPPVIGE